MQKEKFNFDTPKLLIVDSANQLMGFVHFEKEGIEKIKELITKNNLVTLEEYTHKSTEELEKEKPGICQKYNALVQEFKNPDLTLERLKEITKEVFDLTH